MNHEPLKEAILILLELWKAIVHAGQYKKILDNLMNLNIEIPGIIDKKISRFSSNDVKPFYGSFW